MSSIDPVRVRLPSMVCLPANTLDASCCANAEEPSPPYVAALTRSMPSRCRRKKSRPGLYAPTTGRPPLAELTQKPLMLRKGCSNHSQRQVLSCPYLTRNFPVRCCPPKSTSYFPETRLSLGVPLSRQMRARVAASHCPADVHRFPYTSSKPPADGKSIKRERSARSN